MTVGKKTVIPPIRGQGRLLADRSQNLTRLDCMAGKSKLLYRMGC